MTNIYDIAYSGNGQAGSNNRSTDQYLVVNLAPDVSVPATFAEGSSILLPFQQQEAYGTPKSGAY